MEQREKDLRKGWTYDGFEDWPIVYLLKLLDAARATAQASLEAQIDLMAKLEQQVKVVEAAREVCSAYWDFERPMKSEIEYLEEQLAQLSDGAGDERIPSSVSHDRPDGKECMYEAHEFCNKCGWIKPTPQSDKGAM